MKIIFMLFISVNVFADQSDLVRGWMTKQKGVCARSNGAATFLNYTITKKWSKHKYELVGEVDGIELHALLETTKAEFTSHGKPGGIFMEYVGVKEMDMDDGFTVKVDQWRECKP